MRRKLLTVLAAAAIGISSATVTVATAPGASASDNGLSIRPAMGWSSWSFVRRWPTEAKIKAQADALASSGLVSHGFVYINLDDFYQKCDANGFMVDSFGRWQVDSTKFPSGIKALADYVHSKGLKFGFYVTPGIAKNAVTANTAIEGTPYHAKDIADTTQLEKNYNCKNMYYINYSKPGAQEFINSWARQFASWGVDYLKIDGVHAGDIPDVQAWDKALRATGRPINYALSNNLPIANATTWKQLANSWRTQGDVECYCGPGPNGSDYPLTDWSHVSTRFNSAASWQPYAGPGGWNDLDSLQLGNGDQVGINADQRRTMFTLWAMAASPLLLGTDLTALNSTDMAMLTNDRIIAVDQDGVAASRIVNSGVNQVWRKREANGDYIVALFNTGTTGNSTVSVTWSQVGFSGSADVTNLWSGASEGTISTSYSATLRPGEQRLIRVKPGGGTNPDPNRYEAESATISQGVVESNHLNYSGTGFVNGDNIAASYTEFTVNAPSAGTATLTLRFANGTTADRPADIAVNGTVVQAGHVFPATANWDTWQDYTFTAPVTAGANKVRVTATGAGGNPNLDYLDLGTITGGGGSTVYQAEDATLSQAGAFTNHLGYTGTGFVDYVNTTGSYVEFTVNAASAGPAQVTLRYANGTTVDRPLDITVNGTSIGTRSYPPTANWDTWTDDTFTVNLNAGANTIRATATTVNGGPNLDKITVG
ncbi:carbohydrate-binding protein [Planotetraspora sp. A-T 1434]|uniref:carbohydrate-binding protein n=1 Tax=Planotetraspora sp. A-T 1434 TaxID=2979219 RepID=UPI0021C1BCBA|nr:carbohydrate-binding protein [Planotetraspora sp. A-T 1434]MCT9928999.1 carbohydrate-binding protein [Planotetraspora sp. A-T 1434]